MIRCVVGSSLRFIVWVSVANVAFAALGRAEGFWAAKVNFSVQYCVIILALCEYMLLWPKVGPCFELQQCSSQQRGHDDNLACPATILVVNPVLAMTRLDLHPCAVGVGCSEGCEDLVPQRVLTKEDQTGCQGRLVRRKPIARP